MTTNLVTRPHMLNAMLTVGAMTLMILNLRSRTAGPSRRPNASPVGRDSDGYTRWRAATPVTRCVARRPVVLPGLAATAGLA